MTEKEIIKYTDLVFKDIEDYNSFSINNILFEKLPTESKEDKDAFFEIVDSVKLYGKNNALFRAITKGDWCKLTEKGKEVLESGGIEKFRTKIDETANLELKIKELTVTNLELQNKQLKRYVLYAIIGFIMGGILTNYNKIIAFLIH